MESSKSVWGKISMVDADKRLLGHALEDPDTQQFENYFQEVLSKTVLFISSFSKSFHICAIIFYSL